ncbi:MAG: CRISPR-associated helicase Cas3' [Geobacteraceae bacterium]|nr:CRISPR-associated helicase Cas3' [Geobacteraceae bacterium]
MVEDKSTLSNLSAHSKNKEGKRHDFKKHVLEVARLAKILAGKFGASEPAFWAGLIHDAGKVHPDFQSYLKQCEDEPDRKHRGPDHKGAGAVLAMTRNQALLAFLIAGHHGGVLNKANLKTWLNKYSVTLQTQEAIQQFLKLGLIDETMSEVSFPEFVANSKDPLVCELFLRLLFSTLVDADFLDTESHFEPEQSEKRKFDAKLVRLWACLEEDQKALPVGSNENLKHIRDEIYQNCVDAASSAPGFFRLTVPTGGGKTRSGLAFGLNHAIRHGMDRVIVAIPYTSIIEQTADVYRGIFDRIDSRIVLEHHSAVASDDDDDGSGKSWSRLAAENWEAPIVVTTTVQLFESLFSNKTSKCRKLHNIANSVIILDEAQTLPTQYLTPILDVLRQLVTYYRVSVVFCTATQPSLDTGPYLKGIDGINEIIPEPARLFEALKRVEYQQPFKTETWDWERVAREMQRENHNQALAVVNTKKDAIALLDALDDKNALHLSTLLCGAHRRDVLEKVRKALDDRKPCRLVATQVVEAGVDIDFPVVLRALGPLDRIVQAAGRCNREGRLDVGEMVVFKPAEGGQPIGAYRSGTDTASALMGSDNFDFHHPATYESYFKLLYQVVPTDVHKIQSLRQRFCFEDVGERFQMIEDQSVPVVVRYRGLDGKNMDVDEILAAAKYQQPITVMRKLQPYLVNINRHYLKKYESEGLVIPLFPGLWEWCGGYDQLKGIVATAIEPDRLVLGG